ncbi:MAG: AAA family ATPase [Desulfobacterales bacterium]
MKIIRLDLRAFGPFTDKYLDLGAGNEGLHLIYGPNEAGKSSALRALRQMLFGIPARSPDDFLHSYAKMRIGGTLRKNDGREISFVRRKGRANTLRDENDEKQLAETLLLPFLSGTDESLFSAMFGIDHFGLVQGGEEIIRGGGSIGQILFAAGSGLSGFRTVQSELEAEADALFKPSAQKPRINEAINEFRQMQKNIRDAQLSAQDWENHDQALGNAQKEKEKCQRELEAKIREKNRLERISESLPLIAQRAELLAEYEPLSHAVLLPQDFADLRRSASEELRLRESMEKQSLAHLKELREALEKLRIPEGLIAQADTIHALIQERGSVIKAGKDRLRLEGLRISMRSDAHEILLNLRGDMSLEQAAELRPEKGDIIRIQELGTRYERLTARSESAREEIAKLSGHVQRIRQHLEENAGQTEKDTAELRQIIESVRKHGDIEGRHESLCAEIRKAENTLKTALKKLPLWTDSAQQLESLPFPSAETVEVFEKKFSSAQEGIRQIRKEKEEAERRLLENESQIRELGLAGEVPVEKDLIRCREIRDSGWQIIRSTLEKQTVPEKTAGEFTKHFFPAEHLENLTEKMIEAYETSIRQTDEMGDRLRREANRSARKAALVAQAEKEKIFLIRVSEKEESAQKEYAGIQQQWEEAWKESGIFPLTPAEMRGWLQKQSAIAGQSRDLRTLKENAEEMLNLMHRCRMDLKNCLESLGESSRQGTGESLSRMISQAVRTADRLDQIRTGRRQLEKEKKEREAELLDARMRAETSAQEMAQWQKDWAKALRPLDLDADATPAQASAVLEDLKAFFAKIKDADVLDSRIRGIDRDAESFSESVLSLVAREAPELSSLPAEQALAELHDRLGRAMKMHTEQEGLKKQVRQEEEKLHRAQEEKARIEARLRSMCETAGCENPDQLPLAEERSAKRGKTEAQLEQITAQLRRLSGGAVPEDFIREARNADPDAIGPRIRNLSEEIRELEALKSALDQTIGSERAELARMNGSATASEYNEMAQSILAGMERDAEQYIRLRLASVILHQGIERYREKNQGPILKRSGELFSRMTLGSFAGLRAEFNEKNEPVLAGIRANGQDAVYVQGMSEGTADQLYLSLRLAALEAWMEKSEPLPFIADDILIQFDDERAGAALEVLAGLSSKTQVIFFTHHRRMAELAEKHISGDAVFIHAL